MNRSKKLLSYFTPTEKIIWLISALLILLSYLLSPSADTLSFVASLIGITSLILCAKGHPLGQVLIILFSTLYGIKSYQVAYYGEMLTYVGMTLPMAVLSLISWVRHPFKKGKAEVRVNPHLQKKEYLLLSLLTLLVTALFYFILKALETANLIVSTISVTTSFAAVYLTWRRHPFYALAYGANDVVLIVLWTLVSLEDASQLPMLLCFFAFLLNDIYSFINWKRLEKKQRKDG